MIVVTLEGKSIEELKGQVANLYAQLFGAPAAVEPRMTATEVLARQDPPPTPAPEKRGPGRPKAEKPAEPVKPAEPASVNLFDDPPAPAAVTLEQVKAALQKVATPREGEATAVQGMTRAREIMKAAASTKGQPAIERIKDIPPDKYAAVLAACEKALA